MTTVAGIVLAAGRSSRLGQPKQLLPYRGRPLLQWAIDATRASRVAAIYVVLGHEAARVQQEVDLHDVHIVLNARYTDGLSTSLHAGLAAVEAEPEIQAAVIVVGDQPLLAHETIDALIAAHETSGMPIVAADYGSYQGTPLLLHRSAWPLALTIDGDKGARALLHAYPDRVATVPVAPEAAIDVDTWDDYARLNE